MTPEEIAAKAAADKAAADAANGFPSETPHSEMTEPQQIAYWKHHARKHEANAKPADYDALKAQAATAAALEADKATDHEKALLKALEDGKALGAATFLGDAVKARVLHLTGKTEAEVDSLLEFTDVTKFTQADGTLDLTKLTSFATSVGMKAPEDPGTPPGNPARDALQSQQQQKQKQGGGSIADLQKEITAKYTPKPAA